MKVYFFSFFLILISYNISGQDCRLLSKANNILPDKLCSPVSVDWQVTYTGVNNAGTPVGIRYDWDNGTSEIVPATETSPGVFSATASTVYTSSGNVCNYHPRSTLIVNGVLCTSSSQEQIVTVWDDDNHNGGHMHISPPVYPICLGNGADVRFRDLTQFNCVPPQERDNPNVNTRWIQWIYGTAITMTGTPVTINSTPRVFPYTAPIIMLPGPVTGSGVWSDVINVDNDKLLGQFFQVRLRNWNYCNPYDDPNIPGPPVDAANGDHPPVVTTAIILIVPYPDATITPVDTLCQEAAPVTLTAHDGGGTWSGNGVTGNTFNPAVAGPGNHHIRYDITNADGCSDYDEIIITVVRTPNATITPISLVCITDPPMILRAHDPGGIWSGPGIVGNVFTPVIAGSGNHVIKYEITDGFGCSDSDSTILTVATPDATITPVDTLCVNGPIVFLTAHDLGGIWSGKGVTGNTFDPAIAGAGDHIISYNIINQDCKDSDTTIITVVPIPVINIASVGIQFLNSPPVTLTATPPGGTFSGVAVVGNIFNPGLAGIGTHIVEYQTAPDKFGCIAVDTIHIKVVTKPMPVADFEPDTVGCTPMTVRFVNNSVYGESYLWDFGDQTFSAEENPSHTYYIPGNYHVKLTVTNITGQSIHNGVITVYQNPVSIFNAYPVNVINNEQIVVFYNYSHYDSLDLWIFGDGVTSTEKNPYHKYMQQGSYMVSLITTSVNGCIDTSFLDTPVIVDWKTGYIRFPNVFKWNGTGPTGGQWQEGVYPEMDYVFRPFFENVMEYKLQIFNRWGVLIFESNDLNKGWDGYFDDKKLAEQGVYVWKVTGRYADGNYFDKVGDVTFLH
ncbi:MAG: PKD domain-containing protein [Bacteroidales bacterium]|nr:PKD domain-containing protein [Bacteroidales bacterium]